MGPYSMDLRERVAAAIDEGEGSERQIAKRFRVSVSFVTRLLQRRRDAGTLAPKPHGGGPRPVLGFPEQVRLAMLIAEHPDATLNQLKEWGGFACTPDAICAPSAGSVRPTRRRPCTPVSGTIPRCRPSDGDIGGR